MIISMRKRFLFVHIQKTGGTSLRSVFGAHIPDATPFLGTHDTALQARERLGMDEYRNYFKFAFVRNPWARLVSWYTMIESGKERMDGRLRAPLRLWQYVWNNASCFEDFVLRCTDEIDDVDGMKSFTRNQIDYLSDGDNVIVDFIGRYERFQEDARILLKKLDAESALLPHANTSRHAHYSSYYSDELAEVVRRRFARDVAAFGYEFERR